LEARLPQRGVERQQRLADLEAEVRLRKQRRYGHRSEAHHVPNAAERAERGPVGGRKNCYGAGAVWAGQLAAVMSSVLQTLQRWDLKARQWLTGYLTACAENGGPPVADRRRWLPWRRTEAERAELKLTGSTAAGPKEASS